MNPYNPVHLLLLHSHLHGNRKALQRQCSTMTLHTPYKQVLS